MDAGVPERPAPPDAGAADQEPKCADGTVHWFTRADAAIVSVVIVVAFVLGTLHVRNTSGPLSFYQEYFGASVAAACGMGFVNVNAAVTPPLQSFLSVRSESVSCDEVRKAPTSPPHDWQLMHRYQMQAAAWIWRLQGEVSWAALAPLFGLLFAATAGVAFALSRLLLPRLLALCVVAALLLSPLNLGTLPLLRDYSKAPFFLAAVLMIGVITLVEHSTRRRLAFAAVAGAVLGLGFGFRTDVLVCVPPVLLALVALSSGPFRKTLPARLASAAVFVAAFVLVALPPLRGMTGGGANGHVTLLGFASVFDRHLGLDTPMYEWAYQYNDTHVNALVSSYAHWKYGNTAPLIPATPEYERLANEYIRTIAVHFPADMIARSYAAVERVLEQPANGLANTFYLDPNQQPIGIEPPVLLERFLTVQRLLLRAAFGGSAFVLLTFLSIVLIAARSTRLAVAAAFVIFYFGAYTMLQFSSRHIFHLEIFGWLAAAFVIAHSWGAVRSLRTRTHGPFASLSWRRAVVAALVITVIPAAALQAARSWQDRHVRDLITTYLDAKGEEVGYSVEPGGTADSVLLHIQEPPPPPGQIAARYYLVELRNDHPYSFALLRNRPVASPVWDHSRMFELLTPPSLRDSYETDLTRILFPAYSGPESRFLGIEVPKHTLGSVAGIYRIAPSSDIPLLLWLKLPPKWRERAMHQRFAGHTVRLYDDTPESERETARFRASDVTAKGNITTVAGDGTLRIHGMVDVTNGLLVQYKPRTARALERFVLSGWIDYGCANVLVMGRGRYLPLEVAQPGPFTAEIAVPEAGPYHVYLINSGCRGPNSLHVDSARWVN